jgi:hypothetical protein
VLHSLLQASSPVLYSLLREKEPPSNAKPLKFHVEPTATYLHLILAI